MAGGASQQGEPEPDDGRLDAWVDTLTRGGQDRPESRHLDVLVGRWAALTEWEPVPGRGVRTSESTVVVRWVLGGRLLEMTASDAEGVELSRLLVAFDPSRDDFAAFGPSVLASHFEVERGRFDVDRRALVLDGEEPGPAHDPLIHYRRTLQIVDDDTFVMDISYPDVPLGTYGPMRITHRRLG